MSSLARRVQIRALKRRGNRRTKSDFAIVDGMPQRRRVRRGGVIVDSSGGLVGRHWPGIVGRTSGLAPLAPLNALSAIAAALA